VLCVMKNDEVLLAHLLLLQDEPTEKSVV